MSLSRGREAAVILSNPARDQSELARRTLGKAAWRLIPLLAVCYVVAFMDRVNVSYAALQMNRDLGFNAAVYGFGAGLSSSATRHARYRRTICFCALEHDVGLRALW